jgi:hypothetical protein
VDQHEFTALRVTILVRTKPGSEQSIKTFFDSVPFQYQLQDKVGDLVKNELKESALDFEEVIISLDAPAEKAEKIQKKTSLFGRLFGS